MRSKVKVRSKPRLNTGTIKTSLNAQIVNPPGVEHGLRTHDG